MTPGFAKSRAELPWLYYPENDRVIINAHNFPSGFSPAVNGKMPIGAWIPTRTQDESDSAGSNDATLTNGASVVADVAAGGTDAFNTDGINDYLATALQGVSGANSRTVSLWVKVTTIGTLVSWGANVATRRLQLGIASTTSFGNTLGQPWIEINGSVRGGGPDIRGGTWQHVVYWYNGGAITTAKIWVNGTEYAASQGTGAAVLNTTASSVNFCRNVVDNNNYAGVSLDDVRIWDVALDSADIADLYASGNGRGVQA